MSRLIQEFRYKDKDRTILVLEETPEKLSGIEITAMAEAERKDVLSIIEAYQTAIEPYFTKYFRRFDPKKIQPLQ